MLVVYNAACLTKLAGSDIEEALASLRQYENNIWVISQVIQNDVSSTKVRLFLVSVPNNESASENSTYHPPRIAPFVAC